ncbi:MAG: metal ABC transporter ATP-binding protein [Planctomycetota bacterium]|jgi:zinc transport system ATP-binding protein|nr:metal ABC transporter ATP-binding protein [Planctomycetota bacterium]
MSGGEVAVLRDVTLGYGRIAAVRNISFSIAENEYVCLIGRNGCGKSTLIKGMLGLIKPMSGTIDLRAGLAATAFLPQTVESGDFPATVWEVTLSGCQRSGRGFWHTEKDKALARKSLAALGILDLAGRRVGSLSGGQRQRTFLARCLCREPKLLLLDEPYAGLDPEAAVELSEILLNLRDRGIAILMSSHDLGAVVSCASRVLALEDGLAFDGGVNEWLNRYNRIDIKAFLEKKGRRA